MIDHTTISRIQDAAQIVDIVSDFVTLRRRGVNWVGLCPFHDDRTPSFYVSPSKNICKCFSCGEGGSPIHFVMKHEQLSYYEALKYVARKYGIEVVEKEFTDEEKQAQSDRESMFILNEYARDYFVKTLHNHPEGKAVGLTYFRERGFRDDIVKKFQLGYSLEQRDAFSVEAQKAGYKRDFLFKTGLSTGGEHNQPLVDRFRGRVIFPVHTLSGKVVAFGGRILKKAENVGKYVNSPESEVYSKSNELYGIFFARSAIVKQDKCFLVEGYTDVISMHQAGIENVVSSSGTALTHGQIRMIHRFSENITVLYDGDAAGIKAALRGIDLLLEDGMNVKVVLLPQGEDPDSFAKKQNAENFHRYISENEVDFIRFKTQLLLEEVGTDPIKRAGMISNVVESIALIPNSITRSVFIQDCSQLLNIQERVLIAEINKIRKRNYERKKEQDDRVAARGEKQEHTTAPTEANGKSRQYSAPNSFDKYELEILRYVVRYGNTPLYRKFEKQKRKEGKKVVEEDVLVEEGPGVTEFVQYDLERDQIDFSNELYRQMFEEALAHMKDPHFDAGRYFLSHPDPEVNKLASELMSDRYQLSKIHAKILGEEIDDKHSRLLEKNLLNSYVPRATTELKNFYVLQKIEELKKEMKSGNKDDYVTLITQLKQLQEIRKVLAKELGERIVLKY
ncbi:MAG: DNA primase [Bacteroidetes bacterium GWD2_45_23]|nr:MAG: DNA primase [Bacteroidetes bacterium GWC2_46_850]OFX87642.1 MAG: DNA primase [Bacteroidetes bacterium GWD2_45_23]HBB01395.1 DNA primase [Porphyromonadaceae bacterium]HCC19156.1 DNA primase [Porphyromonadaceae bacterium]